MFRNIKILLRKDTLTPSTLFNPFKYNRLSVWRVFFQNLMYELFWRNWWRDEQEELARLYQYAKKLEQRLDKMEKEYTSQLKWTRL